VTIAFSRIVWGLVVNLIDIRFNQFDVLPDALGYGLLLAGFAKLIPAERRFRIAWLAAGVQFVLSVLQLFGAPAASVPIGNGEIPSPAAMAMISLSTASELALLYGLFSGIGTMAAREGKTGLADSAKAGWAFAFVVGTVVLILLPFQLNPGNSDLRNGLVLLTVCSLVSGIWAILLARGARRQLAGEAANGGGPEEGEGAGTSDG